MLAGMLSCAKQMRATLEGWETNKGKKNLGPSDFWSREAILVQMFIHESKINIYLVSVILILGSPPHTTKMMKFNSPRSP